MTDSDNGDYLSDGGEEYEEEIQASMIADEAAPQSVQSIERDALSMREGSFSRSSSPHSRPSSVAAGRKSGTTDELVAGAEAISSDDDENSDVDEDGEIPHTSNSPKNLESPPAKKEKLEPREDLEDGEIETDSEDEKQEEKQSTPPPQHQQQNQHPQIVPLMSIPKPLITPPFFMRNNNNRQFNNNRQKIDFPRQQNNNQNNQNNHQNNKRKRPEDCGVCKFYLRGNCTWADKCKYNHPLGGQRIQWLAELGLPDPEIGYNPNRPRKSESKKSMSPEESSSSNNKRSPRIPRRSRNSEKSNEPKKSPRASPISSDEYSRSPSPKRVRQSPTAISVSSDDSRPPSRARTPLSLSPQGNRRIRSSSSESNRSRSRSPISSSKTGDTTLGALLRKRRLESQSKQSIDSNSFLPGNITDSDEEETPAPPKNRAEAVRRFFNRDPDEIPATFQPTKTLSPPTSPTPQSITSSEDERETEIFKSPPPPHHRTGSESPVPI